MRCSQQISLLQRGHPPMQACAPALPTAPEVSYPVCVPAAAAAGTPVQNNMRELYGILNLLDQEKFGGECASLLFWRGGC